MYIKLLNKHKLFIFSTVTTFYIDVILFTLIVYHKITPQLDKNIET